jgi:hypothetical protein
MGGTVLWFFLVPSSTVYRQNFSPIRNTLGDFPSLQKRTLFHGKIPYKIVYKMYRFLLSQIVSVILWQMMRLISPRNTTSKQEVFNRISIPRLLYWEEMWLNRFCRGKFVLQQNIVGFSNTFEYYEKISVEHCIRYSYKKMISSVFRINNPYW